MARTKSIKMLKFGSLNHQVYAIISFYPNGVHYSDIHKALGTLPRKNEWRSSPRHNVDKAMYTLRISGFIARPVKGVYTLTQRKPKVLLNRVPINLQINQTPKVLQMQLM